MGKEKKLSKESSSIVPSLIDQGDSTATERKELSRDCVC